MTDAVGGRTGQGPVTSRVLLHSLGRSRNGITSWLRWIAEVGGSRVGVTLGSQPFRAQMIVNGKAREVPKPSPTNQRYEYSIEDQGAELVAVFEWFPEGVIPDLYLEGFSVITGEPLAASRSPPARPARAYERWFGWVRIRMSLIALTLAAAFLPLSQQLGNQSGSASRGYMLAAAASIAVALWLLILGRVHGILLAHPGWPDAVRIGAFVSWLVVAPPAAYCAAFAMVWGRLP